MDDNMNNIIVAIKKYIRSNYFPKHCGYNAETSIKYTAVFEDGVDCGASTTLYNIGMMLGMDLPDPEEP